MKELEFIDLFGGIGGFSLALTRLGHKCVWYCDNDKYATEVYNKNFKTNYKPQNIREVNINEIPNHDVLCAGFPCQPFTIAWKRPGFADTRGTLFFEICRIVKEKQPKFLFLENVKGLLSHEDGKTFKIMLKTLDELGYDAEWRVFNSKHFGVPQSRERVYIIGHRRPEQTKLSLLQKEIQITKNRPKLIAWLLMKGLDSYKRIYSPEGLSPTLTTAQGGYRQVKILDNDKLRYLTYIEQERLQGFPDNWTNCVAVSKRDKLLGNAVTVNVVEAIAKEVFK